VELAHLEDPLDIVPGKGLDLEHIALSERCHASSLLSTWSSHGFFVWMPALLWGW